MSRRPLKLFFDGGCRPNPGRFEAAVVVRGVSHLFDDLGQGSNMDAEWLALIKALELAQQSGVRDFVLLGDARAVIAQANGQAKCRGAAERAHYARFAAMIQPGLRVRIRWIARSQNLAGIALAARHER